MFPSPWPVHARRSFFFWRNGSCITGDGSDCGVAGDLLLSLEPLERVVLMTKLFLLALLLAPVQDDSRVDKAVAQFQKTWKKSREDHVRSGAISRLTNMMDPKILACFVEKLPREKSRIVREKLVSAIGRYTESEEAAGILFGELKKNRKFPNVIQVTLQQLGEMKLEITRPKAGEVNRFISSRDLTLAVTAVRTLGFVRHKSSVRSLIERLRRCQQDMRKFILGEKLPDCSDGG